MAIPGQRTQEEIEAELAAVRAARLAVLNVREVSWTANGRQFTTDSKERLRVLNEQEDRLKAELVELAATEAGTVAGGVFRGLPSY